MMLDYDLVGLDPIILIFFPALVNIPTHLNTRHPSSSSSVLKLGIFCGVEVRIAYCILTELAVDWLLRQNLISFFFMFKFLLLGLSNVKLYSFI